ncbi:lytic transglycosylase domain-containing protein [Roseicella sp. DB1501]|jgi:membrane-bound lytic murein transglycosylase B|uniref:lytic transglycosylase domain-containing protein n=1 Tax=Roseicella sp. DB1501 TaxID=2730925 RepID=UPI00149280E4|nr:lytic transglycosylase domain-containing protein [Roseicella sp. DB1501]
MRSACRRFVLLLLSGLPLAAMPARPVFAQTVPVSRPTPADPYAAPVAEASQRFGVPAAWIRAVMRVESANDPHALSAKGAMGLMQIMPDTWTYLRVRFGLGRDPYDPRDNILAGAAYLRELHDRYGSPGFLAAYNAGPGRYEEYLEGRPLPSATRAYVAVLAPLIDGGASLEPIVVAVANPLAWTRAPLFVVQPNRTTAADPVPDQPQSADTPTATPVRDVSALEPESAGLFVVRSSSGEPR